MLKRPTPKKFTQEEEQALILASERQTVSTKAEKSYDPDYPVFEVPVNQKVLIYVPNHRMTNPITGEVGLRRDRFAAHALKEGKRFYNVRCSEGYINEALHLDGSCPLCEGVSDVWNLTNAEFAALARGMGRDPEDAQTKEDLKPQYRELCKNQAVKGKEIWYTFPIVVIDCEEKDGVLTTTPKVDAKGQITGKPMWYSIRENTYLDKWEAGFDALDTEDHNPAGRWVILNFTYSSKDGTHDKMSSAKNLKVTFKDMGEKYDTWAQYFDDLTKGWDVAKAKETVVLDAVRDMDEMTEVADQFMNPVRDKLAMYAASGLTAGIPTAPVTPAVPTGNEQALANFGNSSPAPATPNTPSGDILGELPNVGV